MAKRVPVKKINPSKIGKDLYSSCARGKFDSLLIALEKTQPIKFGWPRKLQPLHIAAAYGNLSVVRTLNEKYGHDAECINDDLFTPVHVASFGGHIDVVEYLITAECHCNPNVQHASQLSPQHYVCYVAYYVPLNMMHTEFDI